VQELTCGENPGSLEGVTRDHRRVGVVSDPLQGTEPRASLLKSLSQLFRLI
jgi:hypothetical protein